MGRVPTSVAGALSQASSLYAMVGLQLGWGPKKTELVIPPLATLTNFYYHETLMADPSQMLFKDSRRV